MTKMKLLITGDFCPLKRVEKACLEERFEEIYGDLLPSLKEKELSITNLECPLCSCSQPIVKVGPHLRAHPKCIELIKYGGFNVVTLANNHIMDHGPEGLSETLNVCRRNQIQTVGAGNNAQEAGRPLYIKIRDLTVAVLNMTEHEFSIAGDGKPGANPLDPILSYNQITAAKKVANFVLVVVHGGHEFYPLPSPRMVRTYRYFVDLGASAVIGHHPHCVSGYEVYKGSPVFYSLGNFIFDWKKPIDSSWFEGFVVILEIEASKVSGYQIVPYVLSKETGGLSKMNVSREQHFLNKIKRLSSVIEDQQKLLESWKAFSFSKRSEYLSRLLNFGRARRFLLRKGVPAMALTRTKAWPHLLNLLQCEAHRDLVTDVLRESLGRSMRTDQDGKL